MVSPDQEKKDGMAYLGELEKRMPIIGKKTRSIPEGQPGSDKWIREVGSYWRGVREATRLSRYEAASRVGVHVNVLRLVEGGLLWPEEFKGDLLPRVSQGLTGSATSYEEFTQRFNTPGISLYGPSFRVPFTGKYLRITW